MDEKTTTYVRVGIQICTTLLIATAARNLAPATGIITRVTGFVGVGAIALATSSAIADPAINTLQRIIDTVKNGENPLVVI